MIRFNGEALVRRYGGWYITFAVIASQLVGLFGMVPGAVFLYYNVKLIEEISRLFSWLVPLSLIISQIILVGIAWYFTSTARRRLDEWQHNALKPDPQAELKAWKEITNLSTYHGMAAFLLYLFLNVLPPFFITFARKDVVSSVYQSGTIASPIPVYILLGGTASLFGATVLTLLFLERLTLTSRLLLLPNDFDTQLAGRTGSLLGAKFQILIFGVILVTGSILAPLGYQQTIRILYTEVSSFQIFSDLRVWSIILSLLVLGLGASFSFFATKSITDPVNELIKVLQKIEAGDLSQRAPVLATDELGTVAIHFNRMISRLDALQSTLEEQVTKRTKQLTATNEVGRVVSSILDPDTLLERTTNLITQQFGYYYAAIFLIDPSKKWAELREATGESGELLKQNHHRLEISGNSMVATCIREKMPRIVQSTVSGKQQRFENPFLPYTRAEVALPLIVGDQVLGALDVQSTKENDFDLGVIETMQNLAGQIAISLENAHLFQEAQTSIQELRAIQKQYLLEGWQDITSFNEDLEYTVGDATETSSQPLAIGINLREQNIGQIELDASDEWTPEQRSLVDAVAAQAAIALENARLVSETRQVAMRERMLSEINSKIWSSPSIENILQTVVKELGRRLDASNATIELDMDDEA